MGRPYRITDDAGNGVYCTTVNHIDIAGLTVMVTDAKQRDMTRHVYDMTGQLCYTFNIDSGRRWMIVNALDKPLHTWNNLLRKTTIQYDALNRPVASLLYNNSTTALKVESITYGTSAVGYTIGKPVIIRDQSGKMDITGYDFKGNIFSSSRRLCNDYNIIIDWYTYTDPTSESFVTAFTFDAMNRPVTETTPDSKVRTYEYNKAGLLERVLLDGIEYVTSVEYNEKGQRTDIIYGNTSKTRYYYDPESFRLTRLLTTRYTGQIVLQDLNYTYDPEGNIVQQDDNAQQINYFSNAVIAPVGKYEYDALYRIVKTEGRELTNLGMATDSDFANTIPVQNTDSNAMQNYTQLYSYDQLGNINAVQSQNRWTRAYYYDNATNRLLKHDTGSNVYTYDAHGNMLTMPHLQLMAWDYKGNLTETRRTGSNYSTYYRYDSEGNRVRKVTINGTTREERIYIGNYEVYRKTVNGTLTERQSSVVSDDNKRIAIVDTRTTPTPVQVTIRYQYDNHLGSACLELDSTGAIISYEEYHPFGTTSYRAGRSQTEVELKRYKYVGKERDEETGLYYYGARYYAAWLCRFVSVDPIQFEYPELTPFQYASNRPILMIDIDGLEGVSFQEVKKNSVTGELVPIRRVIELNIYIAFDTKGKGGYTQKEVNSLTQILNKKYNESKSKDEHNLPVVFRFNFTTFSVDVQNPLNLAKQLYDRGIRSNYTQNTFDTKGNNLTAPFRTENDVVIWKEDINSSGKSDLNQVRIDPIRGIYSFGHAEAHEITHFFLMSYGFTNETPTDIPNDDHDLGGWMNYGTEYKDEFGKTTKVEGVYFNLSKAAAEKIIQGVPRIEDKIIQTYTPKMKGTY